jgi:hypothetical protein
MDCHNYLKYLWLPRINEIVCKRLCKFNIFGPRVPAAFQGIFTGSFAIRVEVVAGGSLVKGR